MATHKIYIDRKMVFKEGVTWTTVPGLYPDAYVPEAALAEAQAEIDRLTAEVERLQGKVEAFAEYEGDALNDRDEWKARAEKAEADLDTIAADAFEAAATWLIRAGIAGDAPDDPLATCIRALTPADAIAAREAHDRAKVAEGMREAAEIVGKLALDRDAGGTPTARAQGASLAVAKNAILARARAAEVEKMERNDG